MRVMKFISVAVALAMLLTLAIAQQAAPAQNAPAVKHVPITRTAPNSGKEMFNSYCGFRDENSADRPDAFGKEQ